MAAPPAPAAASPGPRPGSAATAATWRLEGAECRGDGRNGGFIDRICRLYIYIYIYYVYIYI